MFFNVFLFCLKGHSETLSVFKDIVPNKYIVFDDKEPVWMDQSIKQ